MLLRLFLAFLTSMFTGITLRTPPRAWITVGLTGMLGWGANEALTGRKIPELMAAVTGAAVIGIFAELTARLQKQPVTVYIVSGIIPLVPGTTAYNSMLAFIERDFSHGSFLAFRAFLIASYLAAGLAIVPIIVRILKQFANRWRKKGVV